MKSPWRLPAVAAALLALAGMAAAWEPAGAPHDARKGVVTIRTRSNGVESAVGVPFFDETSPRGDVIGSGIVLSRDGYILTANHIVERQDDLTVVLWDLTEYRAKVVAADAALDVAVLKVPFGDLAPLEWRADAPAVGETVWAFGTPAVFVDDPVPSLSRGIVSGLHRALKGPAQDTQPPSLANLIETDAQLSSGESGGALVDGEGRLVGMCLAVYYPSGSPRGRSFALPADAWLRNAVNALLAGGRVQLGRLGAQVLSLTPDRAERMGLRALSGVLVASVDNGGPCDKAGVAPGDVITRIDGEPVQLASRFRQLEMRLAPGSKARVSVYRPYPSQTLQVEVAVDEDQARQPGQLPAQFFWRGMFVRDVAGERSRPRTPRPPRGALVASVDGSSGAWQAGLREGNVITEVNGTPVRSLGDFVQAVRSIPDSAVVRVMTTEGIAHIKGDGGGQ